MLLLLLLLGFTHSTSPAGIPGVWVDAGGARCLHGDVRASRRIRRIPACNSRPWRDPAAGSELLERRAGSGRRPTQHTHFPPHVRKQKIYVDVHLAGDGK